MNNMSIKKKKIVIIEDDSFILKALEIKFKNKDFDILVASDGEAGLEMARREAPDLVLLDLILPKLPGFKVLEELKRGRKTKDILVMILTNLGQQDEEKKGRELGAIDYFVKANISLNVLVKRVEEVLAMVN